MKKFLLPALALGAMSSTALAEPVRLTDAEMDAVTAGQAEMDAVTAAQEDAVLKDVAAVTDIIRGTLADRSFTGGVAATDPGDLAFPVVNGVIDRLKVLPKALLAAADLIPDNPVFTPSGDPVVIVEPVIVSSRTRAVEGGVFDRLPDILSSPFDDIPSVNPGLLLGEHRIFTVMR